MSILLLVWLTLLTVTCVGMSSGDNWVKKNIIVMDQTRIVFICVVIVYMLIMVLVTLLFIAEYGIKS